MFALFLKGLLFALLTADYLGHVLWQPPVALPLVMLCLTLLLTLIQKWITVPRALGLAVLFAAFCLAFPGYEIWLPLIMFDLTAPCLRADSIDRRAFGVLILWLPLILRPAPQPILFGLLAQVLSAVAVRLKRSRDLLHDTRDTFAADLDYLERRLREQRSEEEKNRHIARLDERNRISRQLHDVTGHTLSSALLQVGALDVMARDEALKEPLHKLHDTLDWGMTEIRRTLHDLHDDSYDLKTELQKILDRAEGFETRLTFSGEANPELSLRLDIIALAREAVTNAARHSGGHHLTLSVLVQQRLVSINLRDDGRGLPDDGGERPTGIGLRNMQEIAARYDGHLNLNSPPDGGCNVHAILYRKPKET